LESSLFVLLLYLQKDQVTMGKSTHFIGLPILGQLLNFLEHPEKDWEEALEKALEAPPESEQN